MRARRPTRARGRTALRLATPGLAFAAALIVATGAAGASTAGASLAVDPSLSSDGVYQLSWDVDGGVRLEESTTPEFREVRVIYEGRDNATTLSGRVDGVYYYRIVPIGSEAAPPSDPVSVTVRHHSLPRALVFFTIGLVVFVSTVLVIVRGNASEPHG